MYYHNVVEEAVKYDDPDRGLHWFDSVGSTFHSESYLSFLGKAELLGCFFKESGVQPKSPCIIATQSPRNTLLAFFSCLAVGAWPLVVPGAKPMKGQKSFKDMVDGWVADFDKKCAVIYEEALPFDSAMQQTVCLNITRIEEAIGEERSPAQCNGVARSADIAYLQLTSATTSRAKLVAVSNRNLLENVKAIQQGYRGTDDECWVSWLPLYHDMGLVGVALQSIRYCHPLFIMAPFDFLKRPARWFEAISNQRATMTAAPNFGFDYAARYTKPEDLMNIRLDSLKGAFIGAEPILYSTLRQFTDRFQQLGFSSHCFIPGYGLAESTVASTIASATADPFFLLVDTEDMSPGGQVRIVGSGTVSKGRDTERGMAVFSCGASIPGSDIRMLNGENQPVTKDLVLGTVCVAGTSVCQGYMRGNDHTIERFEDGVLITGDLGFTYEGELYILERMNNTIIRNGQNYFSFYLEEQVAAIFDCAPQQVIIFDSDIHDPNSDIVALLEQYSPPEQLALEVVMEKLAALELKVNKVQFSPKRVIPRTTSGKKKYLSCRQQFKEQSLVVKALIG